MKHRAAGLAISFAAATSLLFTASAGATNIITVNSKLDNGDGANCTLREAILNANNNDNGGANGCAAGTVDDADGDDIRFANVSGSPDTFALTGAAPVISGTLNIAGISMDETIVDGDGSDTVLRISFGTVAFTGFTVTGGGGFVQSDIPTSLLKRGGGIYSSNGPLTLDQMRVANNLIEVSSGTAGRNLTIEGGGVLSIPALTVTSSVIEDNGVHATQSNADGSAATAQGGGIYTEGQLTITNSTIDGNGVETDKNGTGDVGGAFGIGGGVYADGPIDAVRTTFSNNTVDSDATGDPNSTSFIQTQGAGIAGTGESGGSSLELVTIAGNRNIAATTAGSIFANNAGGVLIENTSGSFTITSSTIADNGTDSEGAPGPPGKNLRETGAGAVTLTNTIVADPYSGNATNGGANCIGNSFGLAGFNVDYTPTAVNTGSCGLGAGTITTDPLLGPLGLNGGSTATMALPDGSPAIDAGSSTSQSLVGDQRALSRPSDFPAIANATGGNGSDIGAYEAQAPVITPPVTTPPVTTPGPTGQRAAALKKCKKKKTKKARKKCKKKAKLLPI